jgi:hypothetical protein
MIIFTMAIALQCYRYGLMLALKQVFSLSVQLPLDGEFFFVSFWLIVKLQKCTYTCVSSSRLRDDLYNLSHGQCSICVRRGALHTIRTHIARNVSKREASKQQNLHLYISSLVERERETHNEKHNDEEEEEEVFGTFLDKEICKQLLSLHKLRKK